MRPVGKLRWPPLMASAFALGAAPYDDYGYGGVIRLRQRPLWRRHAYGYDYAHYGWYDDFYSPGTG